MNNMEFEYKGCHLAEGLKENEETFSALIADLNSGFAVMNTIQAGNEVYIVLIKQKQADPSEGQPSPFITK